MLVLFCALLAARCAAPVGLKLERVATGLSAPLYLTAPVADRRLFVVEQPGRIRIIKSDQLLAAPFLDLTTKVSYGGEQGLLSVAFHPSYASNGFFYVNYTDRSGDTRIERYRVSANVDIADPASAKLILRVDQPYANHNGGHVMFGPDGMLYIGMGDGGSGGDPKGNGQNRNALLGKMLRIDVDHGDPYAIPPGNPYATNGEGRGEIWATGMRNPWRFAFDRVEGLLYIADVGQNAWEEIDVAPAVRGGLNYGWNVMEGRHCYGSTTCSQQGLTLPVLEYSHSEGCSISGGIVYRGKAIPEIAGHYFYGDWCSGWVRSFRYRDGQATDRQVWVGRIGSITSFGEDAAGEMYVLSDGNVDRFVRQ